MVQTDKYGTYNVNNEGYCSWAEFAKYIMEINGKDATRRYCKELSKKEYKIKK